jgi:hypothetical protein
LVNEKNKIKKLKAEPSKKTEPVIYVYWGVKVNFPFPKGATETQ